MKVNFSFRRVCLLIKKELRENRKGFALTLSSLFLVSFVYYLVGLLTGNASRLNSINNSLIPFGWICGLIVSTMAFNDLGNKLRCQVYMLLPATIAEKYVAKVIFFGPGMLLTYLLVCHYLVIAVVWMIFLFFGLDSNSELFVRMLKHPALMYEGVLVFWVLQSIFLFASVYFRTRVLPKLIVSAGVIGTIYIGFIALCGYLLFHVIGIELSYAECFYAFPAPLQTALWILKWLIILAIAPFFWWMGWLRLHETEA